MCLQGYKHLRIYRYVDSQVAGFITEQRDFHDEDTMIHTTKCIKDKGKDKEDWLDYIKLPFHHLTGWLWMILWFLAVD